MMSRTDDYIRSFGMSGFLITEELNALEQRFHLELGHNPGAVAQNPVEYYPQFELAVRAEAGEMARHYELFYCLEQSIRKLISETLQESAGANWWNSGKIPPAIVEDVKDRQQKETDSGVTRRSDAAIDYTTFGELSVIITSNWDLFGTIFTSRRAVEKVMSSLNLLRGPIAHCCPLSEDEVDRLRLTVKDWFRMIG
jgi:Swt1-like HEPN